MSLSSVLSKHSQRRLQRFHDRLNAEEFKDFTQPVNMAQMEEALAFLDQNFGRWDDDEFLAAWEYVLPAIHKLFPNRRQRGFTAKFGSHKKPMRSGISFSQWLSLYVFVVLAGVCVFCFYVLRGN